MDTLRLCQCTMCMHDGRGDQKRELNFLEQIVRKEPAVMWVLGTKPKSSVRAISVLTTELPLQQLDIM